MPTRKHRKDAMATRLKPVTAPISREIGRMRSILPNRARDEDLDFFLVVSKASFKAAGRYIDRLMGRA
jgi:hypothetical protein